MTHANRYDPNDASNLLNLAVLEAQRGDVAAARANAQEALRLRPGYPQAIGLLHALERWWSGGRPGRRRASTRRST